MLSNLFPILSITLNLGAAAVYTWRGSYALAAYWFLGAAIGAVANFWVGRS